MTELPQQPLRQRIKEAILEEENITLLDSSPLVAVHVLGIAGVILTGFSWAAFSVAAFLYVLRVFVLTGAYHRLFSHNSYKTSRPFAFLLAFTGTTAAQCGPLWWASHHRHHHQFSDKPEDVHSPIVKGLFFSHIGWLLCRKYAKADLDRVKDWAKYPEIRFIDRFHSIGFLVLLAALYGVGAWMQAARPAWGTTGWQMVSWGLLSTVFVYHATFCINSLTHIIGKQRFKTGDYSRNNWLTALITMGEGWHNNHHRYAASCRQGFYWYEFDPTFYILKMLSWVGLVWDIKPVPKHIYEEARQNA